jgi:hypothetical protein
MSPAQWLPMWAARFPESKYTGYSALMDRHKSLSGEDFKLIGRWKDGVKTDRKWRVNVAAVAFPIWMQAASQLPKCPTESEVAHFLNDWSERKYTDQYANGLQEKRFGVARATTLLHFLSGGDFPICDSRVKRAMKRIRNTPVSKTVGWYLGIHIVRSSRRLPLCVRRQTCAVLIRPFSATVAEFFHSRIN